MNYRTIFSVLAAAREISSLSAEPISGLLRRKDGVVDAGIATDCTFLDTAATTNEDCAYFESDWGLTHEEFVSWNPSVKDDCSGIQVGHSYCVEVNFKVGTTSSTTTTKGTNMAETGTAAPSPTQSGIVPNCARWHKAVKGSTCDKIVNHYGTFTLAQFLRWNPAVGDDCSMLLDGYYYCVGLPSTPTTKPTKTTKTVTTATATAHGCQSTHPKPTQPGTVCRCTKWHKVKAGNTCASIQKRYDLTAKQFRKWNTKINGDCTNLFKDYYVCVGV